MANHLTTGDENSAAVKSHDTTYLNVSGGMCIVADNVMACLAPTTGLDKKAKVTSTHLTSVGCNPDEAPCSSDVS